MAVGRGPGPADEVVEGVGAVELGVALAEQVEVGPAQEEDDGPPPEPVTLRRPAGRAGVGHRPHLLVEDGGHGLGVDVVDHLQAPGAVEHEREVPASDPLATFLSRPMTWTSSAVSAPAGRTDGQVVAADDGQVLVDPLVVDPSQAAGQAGGEDQSHRHRLAVAEVVVAGGLQGVGQGVAVVEEGPAAGGVALVGADVVGLAPHAGGHRLVEGQVGQVVDAQEGVLGHLPQPAAVLPGGQGAQQLDVAQHRRRLPERPHQVLALGQVDARLAPDGGVDHAQEGGGHVHHRHPPVVDGGGEAGGVGDHAPAHGHHHVGPGEAPPGEGPAQLLHALHALGVLARVEEEGALLDAGVDREVGALLGHDGGPGRAGGDHLAQPVAGAGAHEHVVGPLAQVDGDGDHGSSWADHEARADRPSSRTMRSVT